MLPQREKYAIRIFSSFSKGIGTSVFAELPGTLAKGTSPIALDDELFGKIDDELSDRSDDKLLSKFDGELFNELDESGRELPAGFFEVSPDTIDELSAKISDNVLDELMFEIVVLSFSESGMLLDSSPAPRQAVKEAIIAAAIKTQINAFNFVFIGSPRFIPP